MPNMVAIVARRGGAVWDPRHVAVGLMASRSGRAVARRVGRTGQQRSTRGGGQVRFAVEDLHDAGLVEHAAALSGRCHPR
jgi:hypothetical protein